MARVFEDDKSVITMGKIKVVWICHLSNELIRSQLKYSNFYFLKCLSFLSRKPITRWSDFAIWNTNAIKEFERFQDVELTVVFPFAGIRGEKQQFTINGVHYIAFRSEDDYFFPFFKERFFGLIKTEFKKNRSQISSFIHEIQPDVVHVIGAENPYYSIAALDIPSNIPCVVSLQTLMSTPDFLQNYTIDKKVYEERSKTEIKVLCQCNYIASRIERYNKYILQNIRKDAVFLQMPLPLGTDIDVSWKETEFDFVYFAANINKAADYAVEAFAIAHKKYPNLLLNISGAYDINYKQSLDKRIKELGIEKAVFITGPLSRHSDVIKQIKKSRFALLPLKVDLISGTIRESMASGLPVVTTITPSTPLLNENRESVLLSEKGDFQAMANNMIKLIEDENYASIIRFNAIKTAKEKNDNALFMEMWHKAYYEIVDNFRYGKPFSDNVISK